MGVSLLPLSGMVVSVGLEFLAPDSFELDPQPHKNTLIKAELVVAYCVPHMLCPCIGSLRPL